LRVLSVQPDQEQPQRLVPHRRTKGEAASAAIRS
jgi:hypothetical protein